MLISVSKELVELKKGLQKRGYIIADENNKMPCDAIICNIKENEAASLIKKYNIRPQGVLIIDSSCKTVEDIEVILNNKAANEFEWGKI